MTEADKERLAKLIEDRVAGVEYGSETIPMRSRLNADMVKLSFMTKMYRPISRPLPLIREQPAEPAWIAVEDRLPGGSKVNGAGPIADRTDRLLFAAHHDGLALLTSDGSVPSGRSPQWHPSRRYAGD
jgi:hypothetical protein